MPRFFQSLQFRLVMGFTVVLALALAGVSLYVGYAAEREVERFRATLLAFFLPASLVTIAGLAVVGRIDGDILVATAVGLPPAVLGSLVGRWARTRVSEAIFRSVVLGVLFVSSGVVLASALG